MSNTFKRGLGDRYDGWRVKNVDAVFNVIPYIMRTRLDSQNLFEEDIPIENVEKFIRDHREDMPDLTFMHVVMASMVRMIAMKPYLNRFVVWNKIYARNHISLSLVIKRKNSNVETDIKPEFEPTDTLVDVVEKVSAIVKENLKDDAQNGTDLISKIFGYIPPFILRFVVWVIRSMDNMGILPKFIHSASPFHCSAFLTNVGSLGIGPIFHHLYEFGTCSMFFAMGKKQKRNVLNSDGSISEQRYIGMKFVSDERVCDGEYYAGAIKLFIRLMTHPELLLEAPTELPIDDGVPAKKLIKK